MDWLWWDWWAWWVLFGLASFGCGAMWMYLHFFRKDD